MRKQPPLKLHRSPLVLVLSQIRFSPVLKMGEYVPDIQEALREQKLPGYRAEQIQQVSFGTPELRCEQMQRWVFSSRDRLEAVVLASDFVVYETSRYDMFETFTARFLPVLELLGKTAKVAFAEQAGLRYVDLIRPTAEKTASEFLQLSLRGLSDEDLDTTHALRQFVIQAKTTHGDLYVRSFENTGGGFLPPDLISTHLDFNVELDDKERFRILDIDHIARCQLDFDPDVLTKKLWGLHESSSRAFLKATTPEAIEYWKSKG